MERITNLIMKIKCAFAVIATLILFGFTSGCYYYKVNRTSLNKESLQIMEEKDKNYIFHDGNQIWLIRNLNIQNDTLNGTINSLYTERYDFKTPDLNGPNRYYRGGTKDQKYLLDEVHIYANNPLKFGEKFQIPLNSIIKIEVYDPDKETTAISWIFGSASVVGGIALVISLFISPESSSSTSSNYDDTPGGSSCPFIYTYEDQKYNFIGEIYSGAIYPTLERHDFLKICTNTTSENEFNLVMSNKAKEIQNTNIAELYVVDHPLKTQSFINKNGNIFTTERIEPPCSVFDSDGKSQLHLVKLQDSLTYFSVPSKNNLDLMDELTLTFNLPDQCQEGKLIIRARNSMLIDYSYGKYYNLFGENLPKFQEKVSYKPKEELKQWILNQGLPLCVYVEKNGKWEFQDYFEIAGPMAFKDDILKIDLTGINAPKAKIKIESGKLFWEIDYIGMDFSTDKSYDLNIVKPFKALDQDSVSVLPQLLEDDGNHYVQPEIGNEALLSFNLSKTKKGYTRTIFLHSKGYYQILGNDEPGLPLIYLTKFRKPYSFTHFVRDNYFELTEGFKGHASISNQK